MRREVRYYDSKQNKYISGSEYKEMQDASIKVGEGTTYANLVSDEPPHLNASEPPAVVEVKKKFPWKYNEGESLADFEDYLKTTYGEHYKTQTSAIECFDIWLALGDAVPTFRNTAMKYIWRYGSKGGKNKKDLLKAMHYILLMLHVDHYNGEI
jgi:hypothetical protein